jgi:hypothetical protein
MIGAALGALSKLLSYGLLPIMIYMSGSPANILTFDEGSKPLSPPIELDVDDEIPIEFKYSTIMRVCNSTFTPVLGITNTPVAVLPLIVVANPTVHCDVERICIMASPKLATSTPAVGSIHTLAFVPANGSNFDTRVSCSRAVIVLGVLNRSSANCASMARAFASAIDACATFPAVSSAVALSPASSLYLPKAAAFSFASRSWRTITARVVTRTAIAANAPSPSEMSIAAFHQSRPNPSIRLPLLDNVVLSICGLSAAGIVFWMALVIRDYRRRDRL